MSLTQAKLLPIIARVRRAMPRNEDVMAVCDAAERLSLEAAEDERDAEIARKRLAQLKERVVGLAGPSKAKFDRRAYQRDLMRKRRAEDRRRKAEGKV